MPIEWNQYLQLPEATLKGERIPKTVLASRINPSKKEQKLLTNLCEVHSYATISKSKTGILPRIDDTYDIQAVIYLDCMLVSWNKADKLAMLIHRVFSNPTVLLMHTMDLLDERMVSVATKRKSLTETGATVIETVDFTVLSSTESGAAMFWNMIRYDHLSQNDLLDYVHGMQDAILFHNARSRLGFTPRLNLARREEIRDNLVRLRQLDTEIRRLHTMRRDKNTTFGESTEIRVLESGKKEEAQTIVNHIKELCHD